MAKLVVRSNNKIVHEREVNGDLKIGREKGDIILKNPAVSGLHAKLSVENDIYVIHDLESTNGTYVNKGRITSQQLHHGDVINIGKFELEFIYPEEKQQSSGDFFGDDAAGMTVMINAEELMRGEKGKKKKESGSHIACLWQIRPEVDAGRLEYKLNKETILLGSGANVEIHLKGFTMGAVAASIRHADGKHFIKFLGGFSKLKVNGKKLSGEIELKPKDKLEIGSYLFEFIC